ncbi:MAG: TlpA family protein disulfide reductase [Cryomorphaceae bacterium]|nr:TlpA family protein disulfide reductase [Cryomorphaceae bacterium]
MKQLFFLLSFAAVIMSCKNDKSIESIIENFEKQVEQRTSWTYDVNYKMKYYSSDDDTIDFFTNCQLIRHESDTIFGGSFWIKNDSVDRYYDLEHIYIINHKENKIVKYFPHEGQAWAVKGNTVSDVLQSLFFKFRISKFLEDTTNTVTLTDTIFRENKRNAIKISFQDDLPIEQQKLIFFFDENENIKNIIFSIKFQNETQYNEWHFSNEKYNTITDDDLKRAFEALKDTYDIEEYEAPDPKEREPLANGLYAPDFIGLDFQSNDSVSLTEHRGKYVLIDFWYKDCFPCISAISSLNNIRSAYAEEDLVILGLNPVDDLEKKREKLEAFIDINEMNYPAVFVDDSIRTAYSVHGFPTFYIIDKSGKIIHSHSGHGETTEEKLDSLLRTLIK